MTLGVIVGRFQIDEPHDGHRALINYAREHCDKVLIMVGYSRGLDYRADMYNPLSVNFRIDMLNKEYPGLLVGRIMDQRDDGVWSEDLDTQIEAYRASVCAEQDPVLLFGGRDSFLNHYVGKFPRWKLPEAVSTNHSATARRGQLAKPPKRPGLQFRKGVIYSAMNRPPAVYPTVDIAAITKDVTRDKWMVVMGKKANWPFWRFPGGFVDPSDTSYEEAAVRELEEETGVKIPPETKVVYLGSIRVDDWRYKGPDKIMTSFFVVEVPFSTKIKAADDLERVGWVSLNDLMANNAQITNEHLLLFKELENYIINVRDLKPTPVINSLTMKF